MRQGRPLRFLALTLGGWTAARAVMLWPQAALPDAAIASRLAPGRSAVSGEAGSASETLLPVGWDGLAPIGSLRRKENMTVSPRIGRVGTGERASGRPHPVAASNPSVPVPAAVAATPGARVTAIAPFGIGEAPAEARLPYVPATAVPVATSAPVAAPRLAGSTWFVGRPGGGDSLAFGQLGASQAGVRLTYTLGEDRRVALSGRLSTPVRGRRREGALGLDWRPTSLPVHLLVEGRVPLDGGRIRPAAQLIAGIARPLPLGAQVEAYAQAGAVHRRGGFADGSARIVRPVLDLDTARLDVSAGVWGAAQRGVSRVDLGPTVGVAVPLGGASVRLGLDYRLRVAGHARPGSGPALTVGTSF